MILLPDLAIQGFADGSGGGDVIITRPWHHNLCVLVAHIGMPDLQKHQVQNLNAILQPSCWFCSEHSETEQGQSALTL